MSTQIRGAQIRTLFAGDGLDWVSVSGTNRNYLAVQVDNASIEISGDALRVKNAGITNDMLAGSISDDKLVEDYIKTSEVDNSTIEFSGGTLNVIAAGITPTELNTSVAGDGLSGGGGNALSVNVDGTSIAITGDTLGVVDAGIDHGSISGLLDDDHTQYILVDGSRAFTGTVSGVTPTEDAHLATKLYVDSHVAASGVIDHGNLLGLLDDDHPQYILADGTRAFTGTVSGVTPTQAAHLTTKQYVDDKVTTTSGYILSYVSDNYIDNSEMTTISGDIISYVDSQDSSISGSLQNDIVWEVVDTPTEQIRPKADHMGKAIYTSGDVTIGGNLTVTGTLFYTNTETVQVSDNIIEVNHGETGAGVTAGSAGIVVDRGSEPDYFFVFNEAQDNFRVGVSGSLQAVATRQDTPVSNGVAFWNASAVRMDTSSGLTYSDTNGLKLASGADVNEIVDSNGSISPSSTDDQLVTAKLVYDYVDSISGTLTLTHNELDGLQGGNGSDEYYHLDSVAYTALSGVDSTKVSHWDTAYDHSQITTGNPHNLDLDDVPDGTNYERVAANQLINGVYIDATTSTKGIASFSSDNFDVNTGVVTIKDNGVAEAELAIANEPVDGYYLQYTAASGMVWTNVEVTDVVTESDIVLQNESANCDGSTTGFTLTSTPVDNSVQVFLNGLLQEKGAGKDYTQSGTSITFSVAPLSGDILLIHYVAKD